MSRSSPALQSPAFLRWPVFGLLLGLAAALLSAGVRAQTTNTPPAGYTLCAAERGQCSFSGTASVVYGSGTRWTAPRTFTTSVACNNATFGDPTPFVVKSCYQRAAEANVPPPGYTLCAAEGGQCAFTGTANVVYGARTSWTPPRAFSNGLSCRNATFGMDPLPFVVKACYTASAPGPDLITRNQAARFLAQATFGPTDADIDRLMAIGYSAWIDEQFALPRSGTHQAFFETLTNGDDKEVVAAFWKNALTGQDQLRLRMAYALSQIFVISLEDGDVDNYDRAVAAWLDMLNANSFGSYRTLLEQVSLNPMMGIYLTHIANQKADAATGRVPDENYAREVMQLFSIGLVELNPDGRPRTGPNGAALETYTPADVSELAKVFTGWSWVCPVPSDRGCFLRGESNNGNQSYPDRDLRPMVAYPDFHSVEAKSFLGTTIPAGTSAADSLRIALDRLAAHPNVGPFIGRQLIQRFTTSNPSPAYVGAVAAAFNNNGAGVRGDLKAVLKAVLMHPEARLVNDTSGKVREPVLRLSAFMRAFPHRSVSGRFDMEVTLNPGTALAQAPLHSPSVFNFYRPGYVAPGTQSSARNLVAPEPTMVRAEEVSGYELDPNIAFGRFVRLMRRNQHLTLEKLADDARVEITELVEIEEDSRHKPDPRTVFQLAKHFDVPMPKMMQLAGLSAPKDARLVQEAIRFAARSEPVEELNEVERAALEAFVLVLSERK